MVFCRIKRYITDTNQIVDMDHILKGVARTFYLSLSYLPQNIRQPMALAYLLARLSDTIVDTQTVPFSLRKDLLLSLINCVEHPYHEDYLSQMRHHILTCMPYFSKADLTLIGSSNELFSVLQQQPAAIQALIQQVLLLIFSGQMMDLDYFDSQDELACFKTEQELDQYLYLVAGSVGEFWTRLCFICIDNYAAATLEELVPKAINFGKALQLTNILRDVQQDCARGRCYLPIASLIETVEDNSEQFLNQLLKNNPHILLDWRSKTIQYLQDAQTYITHIRNRRARFSILVPVDLAYKTLDALPEKISKKAVYATLMRALFQTYLLRPRVVTI